MRLQHAALLPHQINRQTVQNKKAAAAAFLFDENYRVNPGLGAT